MAIEHTRAKVSAAEADKVAEQQLKHHEDCKDCFWSYRLAVDL